MFPRIHSQVDPVSAQLGVVTKKASSEQFVIKSHCQVFQKSKLATSVLDEPAEEVVLIDVLVKQLKLDLLPGELRQNDLNHSAKVHKSKKMCQLTISDGTKANF